MGMTTRVRGVWAAAMLAGVLTGSGRADCGAGCGGGLSGTPADAFVAERIGLVREWVAQIPFDSARADLEHVVVGDGLVIAQTDDGRVHVRVRGRVLRFEILDERRLKMKEAQGFRLDVGGLATIDSPMPGKVIKILAKEGDEVKEGQGVIVVEAMKMENELRTPKAGVVKEIKVKEGDAVEAGARLAVIE